MLRPPDRRTRYGPHRGFTLIETMIALGVGIVGILGLYMFYQKFELSRQSASLIAEADRDNRRLLDEVEGFHRIRLTRVPAPDGATITRNYTFSLTPGTPLTVVGTATCNGLIIRQRRLDAALGTSTIATLTLRTECGAALAGATAANYDAMSTLAHCPTSTPRPVTILELRNDENGAVTRTIQFPPSLGSTVTQFSQGGVPTGPQATQVCVSLQTTPPPDNTVVSYTVEVSSIVKVPGSANISVRKASREFHVSDVVAEGDDAEGHWVKELSQWERVR